MSIFISYSRRDSELVTRLYEDIQAQGLAVWMDRNAIEAGTLWRSSIVAGIEECRVFLLVVSAASQQSRNVAKELALAESNSKPILPVLIDKTPIQADFGYSLAGIQFVDMFRKGYADCLAEILAAIPRLSAEPASNAPSAAAAASGVVTQPGEMVAVVAHQDVAEQRQSSQAFASPPAAAAPEEPPPAHSGPQTSTSPLSCELLANLHAIISEELGPVVQLLWSETFAQDLLVQPEAMVAKLLSLGVPEATALRLRSRLQPFAERH
jgi:hypothetical protein